MTLILPENDISEVINNLLPKVDKPPEKPQKELTTDELNLQIAKNKNTNEMLRLIRREKEWRDVNENMIQKREEAESMFKKLETDANILKKQIKDFEDSVESERADVQEKLNKIKNEEEKKNQLQAANDHCLATIEGLKQSITQRTKEGQRLEKKSHKIHKYHEFTEGLIKNDKLETFSSKESIQNNWNTLKKMRTTIETTIKENKIELRNWEDEFNSDEKRRIEQLRLQNKVRELQQLVDTANIKIGERNSEHEMMLINSINSRSEVSNIIAIIHDLQDNLFSEIFKKKKKKVEHKDNHNLDELNIDDLKHKLNFFREKYNLLKFIITEEDQEKNHIAKTQEKISATKAKKY